jgi:hypothetical protein
LRLDHAIPTAAEAWAVPSDALAHHLGGDVYAIEIADPDAPIVRLFAVELVDAPGRATDGNSFVWDPTANEWVFKLATKPFASKGTYTVSVTAGDDDYAIDPTCIGTFVRQ